MISANCSFLDDDLLAWNKTPQQHRIADSIVYATASLMSSVPASSALTTVTANITKIQENNSGTVQDAVYVDYNLDRPRQSLWASSSTPYVHCIRTMVYVHTSSLVGTPKQPTPFLL